MPISANNKIKIATSLIATGIGSFILSSVVGVFHSLSGLAGFYIGGLAFIGCGVYVGSLIPAEYYHTIDRDALNAPPMYSPPPSYHVSLENIPESVPLARIPATIPTEEPPSYQVAISENTSNLENQTHQTR